MVSIFFHVGPDFFISKNKSHQEKSAIESLFFIRFLAKKSIYWQGRIMSCQRREKKLNGQ